MVKNIHTISRIFGLRPSLLGSAPQPGKAGDAEGCGDVEGGLGAHEGDFDASAAAEAEGLPRHAELFGAQYHDAGQRKVELLQGGAADLERKDSFHRRERRNRGAAPWQALDGPHGGAQGAGVQGVRAFGGEDDLLEAEGLRRAENAPHVEGRADVLEVGAHAGLAKGVGLGWARRRDEVPVGGALA